MEGGCAASSFMPGFRICGRTGAPRGGRRIWYRRLAAGRAASPDKRLSWCRSGDSVCRLAARQGLHPGMRLADARALRPALVPRDSDDADAADLLHLARWARRYCPLTAPAVAEATGAGAAIARRQRAVAGCGRGGAERDPLVACRYGAKPAGRRADGAAGGGADLRGGMGAGPLCSGGTALRLHAAGIAGARQLAGGLRPVAALRLDGTICTAMASAGLRRIGDILGMPRAPLASRFGSVVTAPRCGARPCERELHPDRAAAPASQPAEFCRTASGAG